MFALVVELRKLFGRSLRQVLSEESTWSRPLSPKHPQIESDFVEALFVPQPVAAHVHQLPSLCVDLC